MPPTMRGVMYLGPGHLELGDVPVPQPGVDEALVRVRAAVTCGTDVKTFRRGHPRFTPPFLFGHEFAGDVVEVGAGVRNLQPGMRVTANIFAPCGTCFYCKHEQGNLCEHLVYNWGAFAEYIKIPGPIVRLNTFALPDRLPYAEAAVLEPLVSVVHGLRRLQIQPGERVAIIGAGGGVGLLYQQLVLRSGAAQVIAVGHSDVRLAVAARLGASVAVNARSTDPAAAIRELTGGRGADAVIECAGTPEAWQAAVRAVRKGGRVLWFGGLAAGITVELDAGAVHYGEVTLLGVHGGTPLDALRAFELLAAGVIDAAPLISCELPLERVEDALQLMAAGQVVKVAINPALAPTAQP